MSSLFTLLRRRLLGFFVALLLAAAVVSIIVQALGPESSDPQSYTAGVAILVILLLNAAISALAEHKACGALEVLSKRTRSSTRVARDGEELQVDVASIVRGDVVLLRAGDVVPADIRLSHAQDLTVSEVALTGEPDDVIKTADLQLHRTGKPDGITPDNMVFSGCGVTGGTGRGVVVETGWATRIGTSAWVTSRRGGYRQYFAGLFGTAEGRAPLQRSLAHLKSRVGACAVVACVAIFVIGVVVDRLSADDSYGPVWLSMVLVATTLAAAAVPESVRLCSAVAMAVGCRELSEEGVLVRNLAAAEALGFVQVLCVDAAGTLTERKSTAVQVWTSGADLAVAQHRGDGGKTAESIGLCTCLFAAGLSAMDDHAVEVPRQVAAGGSIVDVPAPPVLEVPMSSRRRLAVSVIDVSGQEVLCCGGLALASGTELVAVATGAPGCIAQTCTEILGPNGVIGPLRADALAEVLQVADSYSEQALGVLAVAVRSMPAPLPRRVTEGGASTDAKLDFFCKGMCLVGLVATLSPLRAGAKESVLEALAAGIRVVMVTGDCLKTAVAVGRNLGILESDSGETVLVLDCQCLRPYGKYSPADELDALVAGVRVFAHVNPGDKLEIVRSLQRQGYVSAVTGDCVSDATALSQADIGIAMSMQGPEVAKSAADIVLSDNSLHSVLAAVGRGRAMFAAVQKLVCYSLSVHLASLAQILFCVATGLPVMRTPLQILYLAMITDLPPSVALGMEPPETDALREQRPHPQGEPLAPAWLWLAAAMNAGVLFLVVTVAYVAALWRFCGGTLLEERIAELDGADQRLAAARAVAFIALVWSQNVRTYTARSFGQPLWQDACSNRGMQWAIGLAQLSLYAAVLLPGLSDAVLRLRGLDVGWAGWCCALIGPIATGVLSETCKLLTQRQVVNYWRTRPEAAAAPAVSRLRSGPKAADDEALGSAYRVDAGYDAADLAGITVSVGRAYDRFEPCVAWEEPLDGGSRKAQVRRGLGYGLLSRIECVESTALKQ